jgi:YbbR domain-containing protein
LDKLLERLWLSFSSMLTVNIGTKLISIAIAIILWFVVLGSRNVEVTKEIPLEVITPSDIVASNEIPDRVSFRLSGPKVFLRTVLDRHDEPIRVNLAGAKPGLVTYRFFSDNIRVPIGVKVMSINPTAILIKLEYVKRREVPARVTLQGVPPDGMRVVRTELRPATVRIKGPESKVDGVNEISTLPVDLSAFKQTTEKEVALDLSRFGVQLDGPAPHLYVEMEPMAANYRIKNVDVRVLTSYKAKVDESTVNVLVRADAPMLKSLDRSNVYAVVDLRGKPKGKYNDEPVRINLPDAVSIIKVVPSKVNVTLY